MPFPSPTAPAPVFPHSSVYSPGDSGNAPAANALTPSVDYSSAALAAAPAAGEQPVVTPELALLLAARKPSRARLRVQLQRLRNMLYAEAASVPQAAAAAAAALALLEAAWAKDAVPLLRGGAAAEHAALVTKAHVAKQQQDSRQQ